MELYLRKQLAIAFILYNGQMLVGFGMGWTAPIIPKLMDPNQTPLSEVISEAMASWIGSLLYVGCITGPHVTGYLSNIIGRKPCLLLGGVITALSFVFVILTRNLAMIFAFRIFNGLGIGIVAVSNLVYIGEVASTNIRGILLTATGIASTLGTLVIYSIGSYISYASTGWLGLGLSIMYVISVFFIPESPVFQVLKHNYDDARLTLVNLGRADETNTVLATKIENDKSQSAQWGEIFTVRSNRKAMIIVLSLSFFQQMSGVIAMIFFITTIFYTAGSSVSPHIATIIIGVTQLASSCFAPFFVEWFGRKRLLMLSTAVCSMTLFVLGIYFYLYEIGHPSADRIRWLPLVTLIIFFTFYDFGFGIIPATLTGEMFCANVRSTGSAVVTTTGWLVGFGVSTAFGYLITIGGHWTFLIFATSCACAFLFSVFFVPETKGKSLIEIEMMLEKYISIFMYIISSTLLV